MKQSKFEFFAAMLTDEQVRQLGCAVDYFDAEQKKEQEKVSENVQILNIGSLYNEK